MILPGLIFCIKRAGYNGKSRLTECIYAVHVVPARIMQVLEWGDPWQYWKAGLMLSMFTNTIISNKFRNVHDQTYSNPKPFSIFIKMYFISEKSKNLLILISWFLTFQCKVKRKGGVSGKGLFSHSLFLGGFILSSIDVSSSKLFPWSIRPCYFNIMIV